MAHHFDGWRTCSTSGDWVLAGGSAFPEEHDHPNGLLFWRTDYQAWYAWNRDARSWVATGSVGEPGPAGPQGEIGPAGADGAIGPQGPQGVPGADGAAGAQGPAGVDGSQGPQGVAGADGAPGTPGAAGADGAQGPQGIQGIPGPDGPQGPAGVEGPQGPQGPQGVQGPQGNQGPQGGQGIQGPAGQDSTVAGPQGIQGIQGPQGDIGPAGGATFRRVELSVPVLGATVWTNMPAALSFWLSTATVAKGVTKVDLTGFTQVRLLVNRQGTTGAAATKLILRYKTSPFTQTVANYSDIGATEVSVAPVTANAWYETAWINLVAGAKADIFLALLGSGGDGAIDPAFGQITAEFK